MAIGPVQLLVLGFSHPDFHGEIIAELERLRETDAVRVVDSLAIYKDAKGNMEVEHLSNLTEPEAIELGSKIGALIGLGIHGEEGAEAGAEAGARTAATEGIDIFAEAEEWDVIADIPNDSAAALIFARASLGRADAGRDRPRRGIPAERWVHQPPGSRRDRAGFRRGGARPPRYGDSGHNRSPLSHHTAS